MLFGNGAAARVAALFRVLKFCLALEFLHSSRFIKKLESIDDLTRVKVLEWQILLFADEHT